MKISSTSFGEGEMLPQDLTADGENLSPPLSFADLPRGARSLALIMEDRDAAGQLPSHPTRDRSPRCPRLARLPAPLGAHPRRVAQRSRGNGATRRLKISR